MADENQLKILEEGAEVWNKWRNEHPEVQIDLRDVDLSRIDLSHRHLADADLTGTNLKSASLAGADLEGANLSSADLRDANLIRAHLCYANLSDANLSGAFLTDANLGSTCLRGAFLYRTVLTNANLYCADLRDANLCRADLRSANLWRANLGGADLSEADLFNATLLETLLYQATLTGCKVYGVSVWGVKGVPKQQSGLIITNNEEVTITVDDLQVAQFVYLLLNNQNVRNVIDTITSKVVLILGRFTPEQKKVLDIIREELHDYDYVPILFDFENTGNQSFLETVMTLAGMARFIIADITAATMVREELRSVVEKYPAKPIQPILLCGEKEYVSLPEMRSGFKNILPTLTYSDREDVIIAVSKRMIKPAESWLKARKNQIINDGNTEREVELEKEKLELSRENEALKKLLQERQTK